MMRAITPLDGRYYVTWCNGYHGPTIGAAWTEDFKRFHQLENAFLPFNRNGVLFPEKINGMYMMASRPSDNGHTPFGDIYISQSPDMEFWGRHRFMMGTIKGNASAWQSTKIGAGPTPIKTDEGWLMIYHGVLTSCSGYVYRTGSALLDLEKPWKVLYRTKDYIMTPDAPYERMGDVPNVVFPCAALTDADTGPHRHLLRLRGYRDRPGLYNGGGTGTIYKNAFLLSKEEHRWFFWISARRPSATN